MFTGLIQQTGRIMRLGGNQLAVLPTHPLSDPQRGESIAVNGLCLTLECAAADGLLTFHTLEETLERGNLRMLGPGKIVNLERALRLGDPVGGHLVSGHVDGVGTVKQWRSCPGGDWAMEVAAPAPLMPLIAEKGSIAVDGVSLTVVSVGQETFTVMLIPVTRSDTALRERGIGAPVNLEADLLARYVARQLAAAAPEKGAVTMRKLAEAGFLE